MRPCRASSLLLLVAAALGAPAAADRVHIVQPGESLWQIAAVVAGNPYRWPELYRANRDQIKDPARLYPGQRLAIPEFGPWVPPATPDIEAAPAAGD
jgi:nucleoid-associated protein YgaU